MAEKYDTEAALKRLEEIEARLKAAQSKNEFKQTRERRYGPKPTKKVKTRGLNINAAKQMDKADY